MRGRSSQRTPGYLRRRGPIQATGLARSDQIGSVRRLDPACWSRTVEWLISVTRNSAPSTLDGGLVGSTSEIKGGDGSGRLVSFHRNTSSQPRGSAPPALKKRFPSKCLGNGGRASACTNLIYSQLGGGFAWHSEPASTYFHVVRASASASHPRRSRSGGTLDRYGLMSRIGVPSSMSTPRTRSTGPSLRINSTTVRAMGFGRRGERVANTPCGRLSVGGFTTSFSPSARSNAQMTNK